MVVPLVAVHLMRPDTHGTIFHVVFAGVLTCVSHQRCRDGGPWFSYAAKLCPWAPTRLSPDDHSVGVTGTWRSTCTSSGRRRMRRGRKPPDGGAAAGLGPSDSGPIPGAGARRWLRALDCLRSGGVASHTAQTQNDNESSKLGRPRRCSPFASVSDHRL